MRRFSFFQRNGIYYCQLFNPETSRFGTAKSTGESVGWQPAYFNQGEKTADLGFMCSAAVPHSSVCISVAVCRRLW